MQQTVNIRKEGNRIKLNFMYNTDLVDLMHMHNGYFFRKEKAWVFPLSKLEELRDELVKRMYNVHIVKEQGQATLPKEQEAPRQAVTDVWKEDSVFLVAGHCKKCGNYGFCSKDGLCGRCM